MSLGDDLARLAFEAADEAVLAAGYRLAEQAKQNMPVGDPADDPSLETALRRNVHVEAHRGNWVTVSVDTEYAAKQEFDMRLKHPRGGGARYLQRALAQEASRLEGLVATKVQAKTQVKRRGV